MRFSLTPALTGEPLRNIAKRVSISPAGLLRHKSHVAGTLAKAQERREEKLGDSIFDEIRLLQSKALELLGKMESEGVNYGKARLHRFFLDRLILANRSCCCYEGTLWSAQRALERQSLSS